MDKKILILVIIILIIIIFSMLYFCFKPSNVTLNNNQSDNVVKTATNITNKMPETNPFKTEVNPMDGYTNPFAY